MKLLGWMHRKLRQNNLTDPFKDFGAIDRTSLDEQQSFGGRPSTFSRPSLKSHASCFHRKSFVGLEDDDDDPDVVEELFRGLLAIGTLGSVDAAMQKDDNDNPDNKPALEDLQFMEQLMDQKADPIDQTVLDMPDCMAAAAATMKEAEQFPAKGNEGAGRHSIAAPIFPLQEYLIGSPVVITAPAPTEKKEQRTSLGELFQRDGGKSKGAAEEKNDDRGRMKKVPTRRWSLPPSRSSSAAGCGGANCTTGPVSDTTPASGETKLHKILHIFNRKVHPESTATAKPTVKGDNYKKAKSKVLFNKADQVLHHDNYCVEALPSPRGGSKKESGNLGRHGGEPNPLRTGMCGSESNGNREHWIKTDADYLVLEL